MIEREPTNPELLAAALVIALTARDLVERTDRTSYRDISETLDALREGMAIAGGSLLHLAERLDLARDVNQLVKAGADRAKVARSFSGQGGRA